MIFQLQQRTTLSGDSNNWIILSIYFPIQNSIRIFVNGQRQSPIITTDITVSHLRRELNTSLCGDNIYFLKNSTIKIVVTSAQDCIITLSVADSIELSATFDITPSAFMTDSVMNSYIDNIANLLSITDLSRIKIVGVHTGSTVVDTVIEADNFTNSTPNASPDISNMSDTLAASIANGSFTAIMQANVGSTVLVVTSAFHQTPDTMYEAPPI